MTSVVDKYYRRIAQNINDVNIKHDISGLVLKSKELDSKIDTNKDNISENLNLINSDKYDIDENERGVYLIITQSNSNKTSINENITDITTNKIIFQKT